jgi:DNA-binding NtrC family response regulator
MARVLIVDDDADVRESLAEWLAREHVVSQAAGVPEALVLLRREVPDVVICDFEMPPYRGDDFLATIADRYPHIGRFMHTGSSGSALGFAHAIAHRVLQKGCDLGDLSGAIRDYLHARQLASTS